MVPRKIRTKHSNKAIPRLALPRPGGPAQRALKENKIYLLCKIMTTQN
jgi:hypothetical protein